MSRILIAEDEPRIVSFIEKGLRQNGFFTTTVSDGNEAINLVQYELFDLIILDIGLPGKDGWTVLAELQRQSLPVPVIVVSASDVSRGRELGIELKEDEYITKPFRFRDLLAKIKARLGT